MKMLSKLAFLMLCIPKIVSASCGGCDTCGQVATNALMPSYDNTQVQPFQNYLATAQGCGIISGCNGFYLGTGFGYGSVNLNLKIPDVIIEPAQRRRYSYITEFATIGYAHVAGRFFIGVELGYYYNSVGNPIFYNDDLSAVTITLPPSPIITIPNTIVITPDSVRVDINAQNHVAVDFLPGFALTPCLTAFARIGAEYAHYTWNRQIDFPSPLIALIPNPLFPPPPLFLDILDSASNLDGVSDGQGASVVSARLGGGLSYAICRHVNFTLNYIYKFGGRATFAPNSSLIIDTIRSEFVPNFIPVTIVSDIPTLTAQNTIKPTSNEILLGVSFTF